MTNKTPLPIYTACLLVDVDQVHVATGLALLDVFTRPFHVAVRDAVDGADMKDRRPTGGAGRRVDTPGTVVVFPVDRHQSFVGKV